MGDGRKAAAESEQAEAEWNERIRTDQRLGQLHELRRGIATVANAEAFTKKDFDCLSQAMRELDKVTGFKEFF